MDGSRLGERLGRGASSDVHAWDPGLAVKLFKRGLEDLARVEAVRAAAVHAAGVPTPAVHGLVTIDDRSGVVFDRLDGPWALDWPDAVSITAHPGCRHVPRSLLEPATGDPR